MAAQALAAGRGIRGAVAARLEAVRRVRRRAQQEGVVAQQVVVVQREQRRRSGAARRADAGRAPLREVLEVHDVRTLAREDLGERACGRGLGPRRAHVGVLALVDALDHAHALVLALGERAFGA
jgi:hypothetical protein